MNNLNNHSNVDISDNISNNKVSEVTKEENNYENDRILCRHCKRTLTNQIRCIGKCVEDSEY